MTRILVFLALAGTALAQEPAPLKLTLRDAVALALKQNPQVILANLNVDQSLQDKQLARSALMPQVVGRASEYVTRLNLEAAIGLSFPGFTQHVGPFWVEEYGPSFNVPVFDLTLWRRYRAAKPGVDSARAQQITVREESVLLVVSQYLGCQRAAADVSAAQSRVELADALHTQAADLQKNGVGTGLDTLRSNVELQNEKQRLIFARTQLDTSLFGLARLLSLDPTQKISLADEVSFYETPEVASPQALDRAYATRPELRQIQAQERQADLESQAASAERLPKVTVSGFWAQQGLSTGTPIPVYTYTAGIEVPIFTGGRIEAERAKAEIARHQLKEQEQAIRDRIALEVKTALAQVASARNEVEVANLGVQLAREEVTQSRDRFQAGVTNNLEVTQAQDNLARAEDNRIAALYRYNQARADLAHSTGQMESIYAH
jgi:outer membrane protein TolC